jgi:fructose-specific phosphotransferase system IIA component
MLEERFIQFDMQVQTQREAVEALVALADAEQRIADQKLVVQAVLLREEEGTTGFGQGIAIPHGKSGGVLEPTLLVGRLATPVDWQAMDDAPVDILFLILVPETSHQEHLQLLAKLARKLMHEEFVATLRQLHTAKVMYAFLQNELA